MTKLTGEEIIAKLNEKDLLPKTLASEVQGWGDLEKGDLEREFGEIKIVEEVGDKEGGGDHSMKVFHFVDHDIFLRITGFYSSYDGTNWNEDYSIVSPREKTITVYE